MSAGSWHLRGFGLDVEADFPLPGAQKALTTAPSGNTVTFRWTDPADLDEATSEARFLRDLTAFEGRPFAMLEGGAGDIIFRYDHSVVFHLSADYRLLRCAPGEARDRAWERVLLDTILWTISLLRGYELLHASSVETPAGVVAFSAMSGGGKTSLAAESIRRGARFFSDDVLALEDVDGAVLASPGPPVISLPASFKADALGDAEVLERFGDEQWVKVSEVGSERQRLAAIVLVARAQGAPSACTHIRATNLDLLPHVFGFHHLRRLQKDFELFGKVADSTPIFRLAADPSLSPQHLISLLETRVSLT